MSNSQQPVQFILKNIKTIQFATLEQNFTEEKEAKVESGFDFIINDKNERLIVVYKCTYLCSERPFIILSVGCEFQIDSKAFKGFFNDTKNRYIVPKALITHLSVLTVGTSRGVLHSKLESTSFTQFILPTIDITQMIKSDIIFSKTKESKKEENKI